MRVIEVLARPENVPLHSIMLTTKTLTNTSDYTLLQHPKCSMPCVVWPDKMAAHRAASLL